MTDGVNYWKKIIDGRHEGTCGDGFSDGLEPVRALDLKKVKTVNDLVTAMSGTALAARSAGEAADVLEAMVRDKDCFTVLTLSGVMTVAKMGLVVCDMIDDGMVDVVVSTGALMAHGFIEAAGMTHFKYKPEMRDEELYLKGYDRIYDTIELEKNLDDAALVFGEALKDVHHDEALGSKDICWKLGEYLHKKTKGRGILKSAYEKNVPVYVPAFTDCELGLDMGVHQEYARRQRKKSFSYDAFSDLNDFKDRVLNAKKLGIFTVGGGVPRNWAQQIGPYLDCIRWRLRDKSKEEARFGEDGDPYFKRYYYGVRICPEPVHWGGLSGCTYSEGVSWGKFVPPKEGGRFAEVYAEATIAWPLIVKAVQERLAKKPVEHEPVRAPVYAPKKR